MASDSKAWSVFSVVATLAAVAAAKKATDVSWRAAGVDADARAYLLLRPYLKRAVKVEITDPADPAPYWLVSTRHADALVRALGQESGDREAGSALP